MFVIFLVGCPICARISGEASGPKAVISGVPQESVLDTVLFQIYVNCIAATVECYWKAFADNFKHYFSFPRDSCISMFQGMMQLQRFRYDMLCC